MLRLHDQGLPQKVIAGQVGVCQATVSNYLQVHRPAVDDNAAESIERRARVALLDVPIGLDGEGRRVVDYVNREVWRWNKGDRTEPVDLIVSAARRRVGQS